uniref:ribosomal protein L12 n=1 Tax=Trentepohlia sp. BN17 TaxID=3063876 RepID=UPI001EDD2000|nr:ribosomal protein L12 [Trentepohlia sp. BN17]UIB38708.1 ribosomal protein L12 [Trentepohlia sp. BN17]
MTKVENIIEELKSLTLLEASELVTQIEKVFNVDASAAGGGSMMMPAQSAATENVAAEEKPEEKTSFDVIVESIPEAKRLEALKILRKITNLGISEVKSFTSSLPKALVEGKSKEEAENVKKELEVTGAVIKIV